MQKQATAEQLELLKNGVETLLTDKQDWEKWEALNQMLNIFGYNQITEFAYHYIN
jgi:hypothetical protein